LKRKGTKREQRGCGENRGTEADKQINPQLDVAAFLLYKSADSYFHVMKGAVEKMRMLLS
jgi:hypothetical protein